jgi:hypothetical protein
MRTEPKRGESGNQDHQLHEAALELSARSEQVLELKRVSGELGISQPYRERAAYLTAHAFNPVIDFSLFCGQAFVIKFRQPSHRQILSF